MPEKEPVSPISYKDGKQVINANCTQANDDSIRAARLKNQAEQGNEEAAEELEEMEDTNMVRYTEE